MFSLQGKTAITTGATGGLGFAMCLALAEVGADVVSIQHPSTLSETPALQEAVEALGRKFSMFQCDLADSASIRATMAEIWAAGYVPDVLLNCAGLNRRGPIENMKDADINLVSSVSPA